MTDVDLSEAPPVLGRLENWLAEQGFSLLHHVGSDPSNQYAVFGRGAAQVAIRATRGEWDITASLDQGQNFWRVEQLEAYLERHQWRGEQDLEWQVHFLQERLVDVLSRFEVDPEACSELYAIGDDWMSWRLKIPIPKGGFNGRKPCASGAKAR